MLPLGHAVVGYLALSLVRRAYRDDVPSDASVPWLLLGTQLPDLVDKPLAWWLGILSSERSLGHSLLIAVPLVLFVVHWSRRWNRAAAGEGFAVGYLSHLFSDALLDVRGGVEWITFLLWPALPAPQYTSVPPIWPPYLLLDPLELAFGLAIAFLWIFDGAPGFAYVRRAHDRLSAAFVAD